MDIKELLTSFAQITVFAVMLSMGMALGFQGITRLWRHPSLLLRCVVASFVVVPLTAMLVTSILPLPFPVRAGIGAMAVIPGAPITYRKMLKGPGDAELVGSYQATMGLLAIVLVPLWFGIISALYPALATAPLSAVFRQVMLVQGIPLLGGAAVSQWFSELAEDLNKPLFRISSAMLVGVVLLVLSIGLPLVLRAGVLAVLAVVLMAAVSLVTGHFLGGTNPTTRQTIAIANATRNTGLAIVLITLNYPEARIDILTTLVAYALISGVASKIYARIYNKRLGSRQKSQNAVQEV